MRVAIIAIAKNEQLYLQEWLDYHLQLGFDTIIVADNDDTLLLSGFSSENVIIEDYTGIDKVQSKAYTELFEKYKDDYDWIAFFDIDEFLVLDGCTLKEFLSEFDADEVKLNCMHFTDGDELDVVDGDYSVFRRFVYAADSPDLNRFSKAFINCRIKASFKAIYGHGIYDKGVNAVDVLGNKILPCDRKTRNKLFVKGWFNHYPTKTIGEYIRQKYYRGGPNGNPRRYTDWENYFFRTNTRTEEKVEYAKRIINELTIS